MEVVIVLLVIIMLIIIIKQIMIKNSDIIDNNIDSVNDDEAYYNNTGFGKNTVLKKILIDERGPYCESCGEEAKLQVDHIIPLSKGGTNDLDNLQLLCYECHLKKHNYEFEEIGNDDQKVSEKYRIIRDAIKYEKKLKIEYIDYNNEITERVILPKSLIVKKRKYYLEAYCYLRNDNREFKITRIKKVSEE